jgi:HD-like signal output (HDOD) protein
MRLRLPWRRSRKSLPEEDQAWGAAAGTLAAEDDRLGEEAARGTELLRSHRVETEELGELAKLPPFRPVVIRLLRLFDPPDVKIPEVCALVESDPSLASEMLAVANSPLFAVQQTVSRTFHAVTLLGVDRTKSLAATLAMRSLMQGGPRTPIVRRFWTHSIATATIARHFAPMFQVEPELSHVAALLHDLGRNGLLAAYPERYATLACTAHENTAEILAAEQAEFGMTHCHAGTLLAKAWSLPTGFQEVTGHHHDTHSDEPLITLVHLCCRLADDFMYQAIHRHDVRKPEATIEQTAPRSLRAGLIGELEAASAAIDRAIQALDF